MHGKPMTPEEPQIVRFGDYAADFRRHDLRKHGVRVRIQAKPLAVLGLLVENPGEIVSHEQLRKRLWPEDVFVDFDKNLATAVNKLRSALCDTAARPRYIETVPRLGYRLIVPVEAAPPEPVQPGVPAPSVLHINTALPEAPALPAANRRMPWALIATAIGLAAIAISPSETSSARHANLMRSGPVVVGDFANSTGDKVFDGTLRQGLVAQLEQSRMLNLVSDTQIGQTLERMERPRNTDLSASVAREICARSGGSAAIEGSISSLGSQFLVDIRAEGCQGGELLGQVEA